MDANTMIRSVEFVTGLVFALYIIFMVYHFISEIMDNADINKRKGYRPHKKGGIDYGGDMSKAIIGDAVEQMAMTTVKDSGGYIQNNNAFIERQLKVFSPDFDAKNFIAFAQALFERLIKTRGTQNLQFVGQNVNLLRLPYSIACYDGAYLHNYIISSNTEIIKVFCTIMTEGDEVADSTKESYFLTFKRENPLISLRNGAFLTVSCPNCGGEIDMDKKLVSECPYCHSTVTFAEYDWILSNIEHINDDTQICNLAVRKTNIY
ncbi:MAG: hypothetical protein IJR59_06255 [Firmicutes bacterium]|nr:hypothetical protein [Bacillota bacterium]